MSHYEATVLEKDLILKLVKNKRKLWKKGSGRNLLAALKEDFEAHNISIGRDCFYDLLRENNLLHKPSKRRAYTTNSYHHYHKYPNLIKDIKPLKASQVLVSDITYVWITEIESYVYLSLITDMYSRKIVGYDVSDSLEAIGALRALKMATRGVQYDDCIHHSDRGVQYCCHAYTNYLKTKHIKISMTENGDPLENAIAERVNRTIKEEFTEKKTLTFKSINEAKRELPKFIHFYNTQRPHRSIEMLTPEQAHQKNGELKKCWKTYYRNSQKIVSEELN